MSLIDNRTVYQKLYDRLADAQYRVDEAKRDLVKAGRMRSGDYDGSVF